MSTFTISANPQSNTKQNTDLEQEQTKTDSIAEFIIDKIVGNHHGWKLEQSPFFIEQ
jgi:hypothetical protein